MLGDVELNIEQDLSMEKKANELKEQCLRLLSQQDEAREICHQVFLKYGKIVKIRKIFAKPKGCKNEYYQITIEREE